MADTVAKNVEQARIAIVGAGLMGHGIAQVFALAGYDVTITDTVMKNLDNVTKRIAANLRDLGDDPLAISRVRPCFELAEAVASARPTPVLVDCLTLWLSNLMLAAVNIEAEIARLEHALDDAAAPVVLVSNEVGSGIVPEHPLGRRFRDLQGLLNQRMAARADRVVLMVAGLPLAVKGTL